MLKNILCSFTKQQPTNIMFKKQTSKQTKAKDITQKTPTTIHFCKDFLSTAYLGLRRPAFLASPSHKAAHRFKAKRLRRDFRRGRCWRFSPGGQHVEIAVSENLGMARLVYALVYFEGFLGGLTMFDPTSIWTYGNNFHMIPSQALMNGPQSNSTL